MMAQNMYYYSIQGKRGQDEEILEQRKATTQQDKL